MKSDGKLKKIYERLSTGQEPLMVGPETVVFGNDGTMFVMTEAAKLLKLVDFVQQPDNDNVILATAIEVMYLGFGRPLGGKFGSNNTLYIADAMLGLTRVRDPESPHAKVEIIARRVELDGKWSSLNLVDDVTIGPRSGKVYFTDATDIQPDRVNNIWDVLYASKLDLARAGRRRGRVLEYDPATDGLRVLATGLHFANGISVDKDERFLIISETFQARSVKYYLQGPKEGTLELLDAHFPGYTDGVDCNPDSGLCYVAIPTPPAVMSWVYKLPHPLDCFVRTLFMCLPRSLAPKPPAFGGVAEVDPGTETREQHLVRLLLDPTGKDVPLVTGSTVNENKLYLGFLHNNFVGVYDLH